MKIKINELKSKLLRGGNDLIDVYFAGSGPGDKIVNATVKIILNQNIDKFDDMIELFADKDGYIDTDMMISEYSKAFGTDKIILDLRDYVNNDIVRRMLPNKALAIKIDDITNILK
jgi:c-di-GMP-related signal transduction protein